MLRAAYRLREVTLHSASLQQILTPFHTNDKSAAAVASWEKKANPISWQQWFLVLVFSFKNRRESATLKYFCTGPLVDVMQSDTTKTDAALIICSYIQSNCSAAIGQLLYRTRSAYFVGLHDTVFQIKPCAGSPVCTIWNYANRVLSCVLGNVSSARSCSRRRVSSETMCLACGYEKLILVGTFYKQQSRWQHNLVCAGLHIVMC